MQYEREFWVNGGSSWLVGVGVPYLGWLVRLGVLAPRAENGVHEKGSEFFLTSLVDGGETQELDHESVTAPAIEQTGWGWDLEGQRGFHDPGGCVE